MAEEEEGKKVVASRKAVDAQRFKIEKLMKNPDKPVFIPEKKEAKPPRVFRPPEFIRNIWGSSAGVGSGDFHIYRNMRRRQYAREKHMDIMSEKDRLDEEFQVRLEENQVKCAEKTEKKRLKRQRKKQKQQSKKQKQNERTVEESESESPEEEPEEILSIQPETQSTTQSTQSSSQSPSQAHGKSTGIEPNKSTDIEPNKSETSVKTGHFITSQIGKDKTEADSDSQSTDSDS